MQTPQKIALLGFDCALTHLVWQHINEGIAPNFKKVFENGVVCNNCLVPFPTITPPNWTAMATGAWPGTNGVTDFWRHVPGTTPEGYNTHSSFNWDYVKSESIFEAAEKIGKKSVVMNYPMSHNLHKRLKDGIVIGGASLTPGTYMDQNVVAQYKNIELTPATPISYTFCEDFLVSTDIYPGETARVSFVKAKDWKNVPEMGDDPLEVDFVMPFPHSMFDAGTATWHILARDLGDGYDTVTLSPTKDFKDAFFTIKTGEWSPAYTANGVMKDGTLRPIRQMAKLVSMEDDASGFRLYLTHALNEDGELWCNPPTVAGKLNKGNNVATNNTGMMPAAMGWIDLDTWLECIGIHYDWLGDTAEALLSDPKNWDIFYSHAHPTDYIYHMLMTEMDKGTCSSPKMYDKAWELHRELYRHADRYLGRLLKLMTDDTLVVLTSDHGATPDGPNIDTMQVLEQAGLAKMLPLGDISHLDGIPENVKDLLVSLSMKVDTSVSRAIPQRTCFVYVNLKGRDPEGIVEPEDYEKVQREIIDALMTYVDPKTGKRPFIMALPKQEAKMIGQHGDQCGDVVYALFPEFTSQHGPILPTSSYGIGDLRTLCVYYGPKVGIKQGVQLERICNIVDLVPTFCYMTGWPVPSTVEGSVVYQVMEEPNKRP